MQTGTFVVLIALAALLAFDTYLVAANWPELQGDSGTAGKLGLLILVPLGALTLGVMRARRVETPRDQRRPRG